MKDDGRVEPGHLLELRRQLTATGNVELPTGQLRAFPPLDERLQTLAGIVSARIHHPVPPSRHRLFADLQYFLEHDTSKEHLRHGGWNP
jgi:hypothetical protein